MLVSGCIPPRGVSTVRRSVIATSEYQVSGMTCGYCEAAILGEVGQIPGVDGVDVNARTGRLVVTGPALVDQKAVLDAVDEAGYEAVLVA
jgi:copper chaperone